MAISQITDAMNDKDVTFFKTLGARVAKARKDQGLTQQELADYLGIAQETLAHYEVGRTRFPVSMLPKLADKLNLSLDEMLGREATHAPGKRGPVSRLQQQVDAISQLPKAKQRFVIEMLETVLAQHTP